MRLCRTVPESISAAGCPARGPYSDGGWLSRLSGQPEVVGAQESTVFEAVMSGT